MPLKSANIAIQQETICGRKLQLKPGKISLLNDNSSNGSRRFECDTGLPIDLSKRSGLQHSVDLPSSVREDENEVTNIHANAEDSEISEEDVASDEPLNLSTSGGHFVNSSVNKRVNKNEAVELLQKRVRLEEMVSYIRKCSVVDVAKYCLDASGYPGADSSTDSECDERSIEPCSALSSGSQRDESPSGHRRKPFRSGVISVSYSNEAVRSSYPVLRQQLQRTVSKNDEDESDSKSEAEEDACPHWSAYDYASYYASVLRELHTSAAAQSLLMATTSANATPTPDTKTNTGQHDPLESANNGLMRKRAPRALTGKHVKHGTGASPATLLTLRQKIEQKQAEAKAVNNHQENATQPNENRRVVVKKSHKKKGSV